ncbi:unnamed protein product [Blepharisma stoltei]|uniref:Replication factor-A protein 1 N-terminal domain-containing protein n=1 Tax=Blepharisma stoltei TaxID=1481888 RepID=A0AAU9JR56_9CILI|nr:unnamed protein product [Blepharisma stoltei]
MDYNNFSMTFSFPFSLNFKFSKLIKYLIVITIFNTLASPILLTKKAVRSINSGISCNDLDLTVQIIDIKFLDGNRYYRLVISDGDDYAPCLAGASIQHNFSSGEIIQDQVIKIKEFSFKNILGHPILVIEDLEPDIIANSIIGNPAKFQFSFEKNIN